MAEVAHTTAAPSGAHFPDTALDNIETAHGELLNCEAVFTAAVSEIGPDGLSTQGALLLHAGQYMLSRIMGDFAVAIAKGYEERRG